jgi:hypothetical protein
LSGELKDNRTLSRSVYINGYDIITDGNSIAWYDLKDSETITKNAENHVMAVADKLGTAARDLTAVAGTPTWSSDGITFNGSTDSLKRLFTLNQPFMIYFVFKRLSNVASARFFAGGNTNSFYLIQATSVALRIFAGSNSGLLTPEYGNPKLNISYFNGANSSFYITGLAEDAGNYGTTNPAGFTVGSSIAQTGAFANILVGEIIIRTGDNAQTKLDIEHYLTLKHSITND